MDDAERRTLDVYEIACLAGGLDRVVDTALVALVQSGRVRVAAPGCLATVSLLRRHPVEAAVLDAIGPTGTRSVDTVRWRLTADARVLDLARHLRDAGLTSAVTPPRRRGLGRWRLLPTYAGRHLLHELRDDPPADDVAAGTDAMTVALNGREQMPDQALRVAIFEPPPTRVTLESGVRAPHALDHAEGLHAARQAAVQARAAAGRHAAYGGADPGSH